MIDREPVFDRLRCIILTSDELAAADVADAFDLGRNGCDMVARAALLAHSASAHAFHDGRVSNLHGNDMVELNTGPFQCLRLGDRAGHTVKDVALRAVALGKTLRDN